MPSIRAIQIPETGPKRRLLDAAEALFAERGFDAVSLRDVTQATGANVAAVNYHFGSRDGLVVLVIGRHLGPLNEERVARLEVLDKKWPGKTVPVEELLDAYARPMFGLARKSSLPEPLFKKLLGRILSLGIDALPEDFVDQVKDLNDRLIRLLARALPGLTQEELIWRWHFVVGSGIYGLLCDEGPQRSAGGGLGPVVLETMLGRWIRFGAAGLRDGVESGVVEDSGPQGVFQF